LVELLGWSLGRDILGVKPDVIPNLPVGSREALAIRWDLILNLCHPNLLSAVVVKGRERLREVVGGRVRDQHVESESSVGIVPIVRKEGRDLRCRMGSVVVGEFGDR
jgi:hypothetical protein